MSNSRSVSPLPDPRLWSVYGVNTGFGKLAGVRARQVAAGRYIEARGNRVEGKP